MDMASDFGSEDGGFESLRGRFLLNSYIHFFFLLNNHCFLIFFFAGVVINLPCFLPN